MTWAVFISVFLISVVKILMTCLPTGVVDWLLHKFETHSMLKVEETTITYNGKRLEDEEKLAVIEHFNKGIFIEKYNIFPGHEQQYLQPENAGLPFVINTKKGKMDVELFLYSYSDRVDVVKQYKKKVVAYSLFPIEFNSIGYQQNSI